MKEIILKLSKEARNDFLPIVIQLRLEGKNDRFIKRAFEDHVNSKVLNYYNSRKRKFGFAGLVKRSLEDIKKKGYDSKAEIVFETMLLENKIKYKCQYKIGPYRADFLLDGFLVVEIDGDHHKRQIQYDRDRDNYMRKLGYKILRLPIWIIAMSEKAVIDEIMECINKNGPN